MNRIRTEAGHFAAATIVISGSAIFAILMYFGLLAWAIASGQGLGSPAAFPVMLVIAMVAGGVSVAIVLFPSTWLPHHLVNRLGWSTLVEIPVSTVLTFIGCASIGSVTGLLLATAEPGFRLGLFWAVALLVPLGMYWWCLQISTSFLGLGGKVWHRLAALRG